MTESRRVLGMVAVLMGSDAENEDTNEAGSSLFHISGESADPESLKLIAELDDHSFKHLFRPVITVAKMRVASNENTPPKILDFIARQVIEKRVYKNDEQLMLETLDSLLANPSTPKETKQTVSEFLRNRNDQQNPSNLLR